MGTEFLNKDLVYLELTSYSYHSTVLWHYRAAIAWTKCLISRFMLKSNILRVNIPVHSLHLMFNLETTNEL